MAERRVLFGGSRDLDLWLSVEYCLEVQEVCCMYTTMHVDEHQQIQLKTL